MSEPSTPDARLVALIQGPRKKKVVKPFVPPLSIAWIFAHTRMTYYRAPGKAFCYNTRPMLKMAGNKNRQWAAWKMRVNYAQNKWTPIEPAQFFTRRKLADRKARSWYDKAIKKKTEATASQTIGG